MADFDPLDLLSASLDRADQPDPGFEARLLADLLANFDAPQTSNTKAPGGETMVDLVEHREITEPETETTRRRPIWALIAAVAALAVAGAVVLATRGGGPETVTVVNAPEPNGSLDVPTAAALIEGAGGPAGLEVATFPADRPTTLVTFDPLDPDRVLVGDIVGASADLWITSGDEAELGVVPWLAEQSRNWQGGIFQRDGGIVVQDGGFTLPTDVVMLDNGGQLIAMRDVGAGVSYLPNSEGERAMTLTTGAVTCPYSSVVIADADGPVVVDDRLRAFVRTDIPQPGIGMAFPYLGPIDSCDPPASTIAQAWDLETGQRLTDYPLDGLEIARAAVSGDGRIALAMGPQGAVSVVDMDTGDVVRELGEFDSRLILNPLALSDDGSIAVVAEDTGRTTVWHTETGTLLLDLASDLSALQAGRTSDAVGPGAGVAYDAGRVAILDEAAGVWRVLTLDPNDWAQLACDAGAGVSEEDLAGRGLDPGAGC